MPLPSLCEWALATRIGSYYSIMPIASVRVGCGVGGLQLQYALAQKVLAQLLAQYALSTQDAAPLFLVQYQLLSTAAAGCQQSRPKTNRIREASTPRSTNIQTGSARPGLRTTIAMVPLTASCSQARALANSLKFCSRR